MVEHEEVGQVCGVLHVVRRATPDEVAVYHAKRKTRSLDLYYVKCVRCSATYVRTIHSIRASAKRETHGCSACGNYDVYPFEDRMYTVKGFAKAYGIASTYVARCVENGETLATALERAEQLKEQGRGTNTAHREKKCYIGTVYGTRKITGRKEVKPNDTSHRWWLYECLVCGETGRTTLPNLQGHACQNCAKVGVGRRYGTRVVVELAQKTRIPEARRRKHGIKQKHKFRWRCRCEDCGTEYVTSTPQAFEKSACQGCVRQQQREQVSKAMFAVGTMHGSVLILRAYPMSNISRCRYDVRCTRCSEEYSIGHPSLAKKKDGARCVRCRHCDVYTVGGQLFTPARIKSVFGQSAATVVKRMQRYDLSFEEALLLDTSLQRAKKATLDEAEKLTKKGEGA